MTQKMILVFESAAIRDAVLQKTPNRHAAFGTLQDGRSVAIVYPRHHEARFLLAQEPGVTVLPGAHDPGPIGETVARALAHVNAKPTETMREVGLRLHEVHGPAFHPDT